MGEFFSVAGFRATSREPVVQAPCEGGMSTVPEWMQGTKGNLDHLFDNQFPESFAARVAEFCSQIQAFRESGGETEPVWHAAAGIAKHCVDGQAKYHEWSAQYEGYSEAETQGKLDNWKTPPTTCAKFDQVNPTGCQGCAQKGLITSPISLGYAVPEAVISPVRVALPRLNSDDGVILFSDEPPPHRDFTIGDIMLMAKVCLLAGFGGVSKTQWLLHATACIALGLPFMGKATIAGAVLLLLGEEDQAEIARRFNAITKMMKLTPEQIDIVRQRVRAFPMVGLDMRLTHFVGGSLEGTGFAAEIIEAAQQLEADCGLAVRMIGLDHAGLIHGGEFNAREDVVQTMRQVNHIAQESGAAVLVLAHSPKAAAGAEKSTASAVAGSTAWVDHARGASVLRAMNDDEGKRYGIEPDGRGAYVSLTVVKNNYGPTGGEFWLMRESAPTYGVGLLRHVELREPIKVPSGTNIKLRTEIYDLVLAKPCLTKNAVEGHASVKDGRIRASKAVVRAEVEMMLADGALAFRQPTEEERLRVGIKSKTSGFLCTGATSKHQSNSGSKAKNG